MGTSGDVWVCSSSRGAGAASGAGGALSRGCRGSKSLGSSSSSTISKPLPTGVGREDKSLCGLGWDFMQLEVGYQMSTS